MTLPLFAINILRGSPSGNTDYPITYNIMLNFVDHPVSYNIMGSSVNLIGAKLKRCVLNINFIESAEVVALEKFLQTFDSKFRIAVVTQEILEAGKLKDLKAQNAAIDKINKKYFSKFIGRTVSSIIV